MRTLIATPVAAVFEAFTSRSEWHGIRLAFRSLPESERRWTRTIVSAHSRNDSAAVAARLGVREPVAGVLITLLHPDA